jgi:hypothetical protein
MNPPVVGAGRPILVLGMHRSGTSCLAGSLQAAGLTLGEVNTDAPHNALGNRENLAVMDLNDKVLDANGGDWRHPPRRVVWPDSLIAEGKHLASSMAQGTPWGFKDPRTVLTLDGWLECLGDIQLAASFRHPLAVAQSLNRRDPELSIAEGLDIWRAYNERLLAVAERRLLRVISYDRRGDEYLESVVRLARALGLPDPDAAGRFYDIGLRHQEAANATVHSPQLASIYGRLQDLAL